LNCGREFVTNMLAFECRCPVSMMMTPIQNQEMRMESESCILNDLREAHRVEERRKVWLT
jgi:hypothetical protein